MLPILQVLGISFSYVATLYFIIFLKYNNFSQVKVLVPSIEEQQGVAKVLSTADYEIKQLEKKLQALEKQKRGLMQKLLTGEMRVK